MILLSIITFFISYEAILWGWSMNRHGYWLKRHPEHDKRRMVSHTMLRIASIMTSSLSILMWLWWVYLMVTGVTLVGIPITIFGIQISEYICTLLVITVQLSHIHFSAIIARYSCLPRSMWPLLSQLVSKALVKFTRLDPPLLNSADVHKCWGHGKLK